MRGRQKLPLEALAPQLYAPPEAPGRLDWAALFGNANPVEIEVGFGKGLFLLTSATANPGVNYLGIEIVRAYQLLAATRAVRQGGLPNLKLVCGDAKAFLRDRVPPGSLRAMHVYFPDPWWKQRHAKRRLFTPEFAGLCAEVLPLGRVLHVVTDVGDYFEVMREVIAGEPRFRVMSPPEVREAEHDLDYLTHFERKYRQEGRPIYRMNCERVADATPAGV